jgi:hypothetical protein
MYRINNRKIILLNANIANIYTRLLYDTLLCSYIYETSNRVYGILKFILGDMVLNTCTGTLYRYHNATI